jgi:hypothetical protein
LLIACALSGLVGLVQTLGHPTAALIFLLGSVGFLILALASFLDTSWFR